MPNLSRRLNSLPDAELWAVVGSYKKNTLVRWLQKRMSAAGFPMNEVLALKRATKAFLVELAVDEIRDPW